MRKHFLLVFLLALLPLVTWAKTDPTPKTGLWASTSDQELVNAGTPDGGKAYWYAVSTTAIKPAKANFSKALPEASAAGTYYVWYVQGNDGDLPNKEYEDHTDVFEVTLSELSVSPTFAQYDAANHELPTVSWGSTAIYNGMNDGNGGTWTVAWKKGSADVTFYENVGTYTVTATNSTGSGTATFEVTKGTNWFTTDAVTISNWTYGGTASTPSGAEAKWGTVEYEYWDGSAWSATAPTDAAEATYKVRPVVAAEAVYGNYDRIEGTPVDFDILKATASWDTPPEAIAGFEFNNTEYSLIDNTPVVTGGGTPKYKVVYTPVVGSATTTSGLTDPKGKNAGTYQIYYSADASSNYAAIAESTEPLEVVITQADLDVTVEPTVLTGLTYKAEDQKVLEKGLTITQGYNPTYTLKQGENVVATATSWGNLKAKDAGTYKAYYKADPSSTYANNYKTTGDVEIGDVVIDKYEVIIGGNKYEGTIEDLYDKTDGVLDPAKPLFTAADFLTDVTILAADNGDREDILNGIVTMTVPAFDDLDVGNNNVTFAAVADDENTTLPASNYTANVIGSTGNLKINALAASIAAGDEPTVATTLVYTGQPQALLASAGAANGGTVVYSLDETAAIDTWAEAYNDDAIKGTLATSYSVFYTVKPDKFYEYTAAPVELTTSIAKKQLSDAVFELAEEEATYDGTSKASLIALDYDNTTEPLDGEYALQIPDPITAASAYTITIVPKDADGNYQGSTTRTFTINAATNNAISNPVIASWTYGGTASTPTATATYFAAGEPTFTYYEDNDGVPSTTALTGVPTKAGDYWVVASVAGTGDYNGIESEPVAFTINKADVAEGDITPAKAEVLTYDNTNQVLIQAATSTIGSFKYFVGETAPAADSENWSDKIATITGKDAATYKVWTLFVPDNNHNAPKDNPTYIDVTIQKAVIQYRLANAEKDWDGQPFADDEITAAYTPEIGGLLGDDITADPAPFTLSVPDQTITDAGTYTFTKLTVTPAEPTNYDVRFSGTAQLTINKADIVAADFDAPEALNPEFNGKAQDLVSEGEMKEDHEFGTFYYAQAKDVPAWNDNDATHAGWSLTVPQATNANHYPVWYAIAGDNNHNSYVVPAAIDATITAAKLAVTMLPAKYQKPVESTYTAYDQTPSDITLTGLTVNQDYKIQNPYAETGIVDVDTYTLTVVGLNNYAGSTLPVVIKITQAPLMVTAPSAEKTYDATNVVEATEFGKPVFNGLLGEDAPFDLGNANDYVTVPATAINAGEYELTMAIGDVPAQKNYEVKAVLPGTLTINKVKNAKIGITKKYTKVYGEADPTEFTFAASDLTQEGIADNLTAIVGQLKATRTETGEEVTEEGKGYKVQLALTDKAKFQENYENIEFGSTIMSITPAKLTISIASASKPYDGKPAELKWADDLENMVVAGLPEGKEKAEIFSTLPTIAIVAKEENTTNANTYNILLSGGESANYDVTLIQGSYFTIDPVAVEGQFNNTYTTEVGAAVADVLASVDWTVVAADEDQIGAEETVAAALALTGEDALFELTYVGAQDKDKKIAAGETGENALLIVYKGTETPNKNFKFVAGSDKGNLNVGAAGSVLTLDDSEDVVTTKGKATVTFSQSRNVKQDVWQAAVLPFKTTPAEISDAFGYAAVDVLDPTRTNAEEVHFCLKVTGDIEAGTPFLFKTDNNNNFNNVTFENVDVVATEGLNTTVKDDDTDIEFIGTFEKVGIYGEQFRYLSGGTWYNAAKYTSANPAYIKPLRAYLNMTGASATARIVIEEPDGTTSIMDVNSFNDMLNAEGWYTIEGKKLNAAPTQKGVYIQNGKKVVIK